MHHHHLPEVFDAIHIAPDEQRFKILFHRGGGRHVALRERRAAQAEQPRLAGLDFHHHQIDARRCGKDRAHGSNRYHAWPLYWYWC
jgi:hypothetical protein